jgi:hypothetical protein
MRGRLPGEETKTNVTFALTDETNAKLALLTYDPISNRAKYGLKSKLAEELFKRFAAAVGNSSDIINIRDLRVEVSE